MLLKQRLQGEISQEVSAIDDEVISLQQVLHVLNATTCSEQDRFMSKIDFTIPICIAKNVCESFRPMMGVNDERLHAKADEMIERKSNERFLKDRNEWLG